MPSIVNDASAIFVAIIILRDPSGVFLNINYYFSYGNAAYTGYINKGLILSSIFLIFYYNIEQAVSISSYPVKNNNISPLSSDKCIFNAHYIDAYKYSISGF